MEKEKLEVSLLVARRLLSSFHRRCLCFWTPLLTISFPPFLLVIVNRFQRSTHRISMSHIAPEDKVNMSLGEQSIHPNNCTCWNDVVFELDFIGWSSFNFLSFADDLIKAKREASKKVTSQSASSFWEWCRDWSYMDVISLRFDFY